MKKLLCLLLLSSASVAMAETAETPIDNIIVSGTRSHYSQNMIPASISVITREDIIESGALHLVDVLRMAGGLQITDLFGDGSRASIDMRGFGESANSNVLVLVDGRRLNNSDKGSPDLNSIALKNIQRIEIINGSSGSLYGDQAVGGVINIVTLAPQDLSIDASVSIGSYARTGLQAMINDRLNNGLAYAVSVETRQADNYRQHNRQEYSAFNGRLDYQYTDGSIFMDAQWVDEKLQTPGSLVQSEVDNDRRFSHASFANDFADLITKSSRVGIEQNLSDGLQFLMELSHREGEGDFILNFRSCAAGSSCNTKPDHNQREQTSVTPRIVANINTTRGDVLVTLGYDNDQHDYKLDSAFVKTTNEQKAESTYLNAILPFSDSVNAKIGVRSASVENELTDMGSYPAGVKLKDRVSVGEFGLNWQALDVLRVYARNDQNYRFAKADEQNLTIVGVVGLETQEGDSRELGVDLRLEKFNVQLAATQLRLENEIAFDPTANGPFGPFGGANVNFDRTQRDTLYINTKYQLLDGLSFQASVSQVEAVFLSGVFKGKDISGVANNVSKLAINFSPMDNLQLYVEAQHTGSQYLSGDNANAKQKQSGYTVINFNTQWQLAQWRLSARLNNVSNRKYIESANTFGALQPSPERNFVVTLSYQFQ